MNEFESYKLYISIKNHFNNKKYSHITYNGKTTVKYSSFEKRKDKIFFLKLSKHSDLENFLISNFIVNEKYWIKDLAYSEEAEKNYKSWIKRKQSLTYSFKQDLDQLDTNFNFNLIIENNSHPNLLKLYLSKSVSLETLCILLDLSGAIGYWNKKLEYDPVWESIQLRVEKYTPFIDYDKDKFKKIVLDFFENT